MKYATLSMIVVPVIATFWIGFVGGQANAAMQVEYDQEDVAITVSNGTHSDTTDIDDQIDENAASQMIVRPVTWAAFTGLEFGLAAGKSVPRLPAWLIKVLAIGTIFAPIGASMYNAFGVIKRRVRR